MWYILAVFTVIKIMKNMGEKTQKNKWEIYRSITCKHKQPDICKSIF